MYISKNIGSDFFRNFFWFNSIHGDLNASSRSSNSAFLIFILVTSSVKTFLIHFVTLKSLLGLLFNFLANAVLDILGDDLDQVICNRMEQEKPFLIRTNKAYWMLWENENDRLNLINEITNAFWLSNTMLVIISFLETNNEILNCVMGDEILHRAQRSSCDFL